MVNHQHNDPLEEFFRKKALEYDIEYHEEDWQKLEKRLDAADSRLPNQWIRYAAALVILLFSVLAYITYQQQMKINQLNEQLTNTQQGEAPQHLFKDILPPDLFDFTTPERNQDGREPENDETGNYSQRKSLVRDDSPFPTESDENTEGRKQELSTDQKNTDFITQAMLKEPDLRVSPDNPDAIINEELQTSIISQPRPPGYTPANPAETLVKRNEAFSRQSDTPRSMSTGKSSGLTLGVLAGPDLSTVGGLSNFYEPGYKIGLSIEYALTKRLALSVGAVHSKVQYSASGKKYNPPPGYWSYGNVPNETVGKCYLIDIPVNLKYSFMNFDHSRLFATAGASSYIMLNEDYRFRYGYNRDQPGLPRRWNEDTGTVHMLSNATFSLGYEIDLNRQFSFRAEPFIKVPMREVGWGNVKLYSIGTMVSINYKLF